MKYRIKQTTITESKDYFEEEIEEFRKWHPRREKVVWQRNRSEDFEKRVLKNREWHTFEDWPTTSHSGWVCYSYALERFNQKNESWEIVCFINPICEDEDC